MLCKPFINNDPKDMSIDFKGLEPIRKMINSGSSFLINYIAYDMKPHGFEAYLPINEINLITPNGLTFQTSKKVNFDQIANDVRQLITDGRKTNSQLLNTIIADISNSVKYHIEKLYNAKSYSEYCIRNSSF